MGQGGRQASLALCTRLSVLKRPLVGRPAGWSVSCTNGPFSVSYEKRLRRLTSDNLESFQIPAGRVFVVNELRESPRLLLFALSPHSPISLVRAPAARSAAGAAFPRGPLPREGSSPAFKAPPSGRVPLSPHGGGPTRLLPDCWEVTWTPASPGRKDCFASDGSPSGEAGGLSFHPEGRPGRQPRMPMGWPWPSTSERCFFVYCEKEHRRRKLGKTSASGVQDYAA
uniref:Uncharacterized protein n=1 Tax=Rangifer tarandus platyrhynchus TaxID=3082113 RepID=A0ACB0DPS3_RANTA|nr:unnamed protein product [Rangifer tarandus platyrhynchus]